ncbi:hypothetical protein NUM3379_34970 [Kineococcus sp. NUM-3379]
MSEQQSVPSRELPAPTAAPRTSRPSGAPLDISVVLADMQDQIDDLAAVVRSQQEVIEALRRQVGPR